jgi:hypothetical protein
MIEGVMKTEFHSTGDLITGKAEPPFDLAVISNHMGINLCSVDGLSWTRQKDGQLVSLTIHFIPAGDDRGQIG